MGDGISSYYPQTQCLVYRAVYPASISLVTVRSFHLAGG
ncbi:hypothetical protein AM1_D0140 (plasmid) [Acaryochloris marina MBIC11017]|uniref:Uncharacterized protein n=1 Tax=Acaryochloris marina (strain MBIC 11017) TaxID=329726 RepID=A8ZNP9_ACAM1|nr:hypothetical protein AM1_D0140 [Acaryochloris marina MBIC11017]